MLHAASCLFQRAPEPPIYRPIALYRAAMSSRASTRAPPQEARPLLGRQAQGGPRVKGAPR